MRINTHTLDMVSLADLYEVGSSPAAPFEDRRTTESFILPRPECAMIRRYQIYILSSLPRNAMSSHFWRHLHPEEHTSRICETTKDAMNRQKSPVNDRRELDKPLPEPDRSTSAIWRAPRKSRSKLSLCSRLSLEVPRPLSRSRAP